MPQSSQPPQSSPRVARCECGALQLTVSVAPVHVHACACTRCQRVSGSAMSMSAWFPETGVVITGAYSTYFFTAEPAADLMAAFCPRCGGGKFFRTGAYLRGCIGISVGSFADPDFPAPDHIHWWPNRPRWLAAPHGPALLDGN